MRTSTILVPLLVFLSGAGSASAQELSLEFREGLVRLTATNVPASQILSEWSRLGGTRIVNAERALGAPLTLLLVDVPERQALDTVLRGTAGYMVTVRQTAEAGASVFDRIFVLPTTMPVLATSQPQQPAQPVPSPQADLGLAGVPRGQVPTPGLNPPANAPPQVQVDDAVEDDDELEPDEQVSLEPASVPRGQVPTPGLNLPVNVPPQRQVDDAVEDEDDGVEDGPPVTRAPASPAPAKPSGTGAARPGGVTPPPAPRDPKGVLDRILR
jgi:hypothetical protein